MAGGICYSIDSSSLIHGWRRVYRPKNFPFVWDRLDSLARDGRLRVSVEVYHELAKKDDELHAWCKERKEALVVDLDDQCLEHVSRIMSVYPRLVDTVKNRSGGDPFVIALAATGAPPMTIVTEEQPGKTKIPDVCMAEGLPYLGLADMIEQEDWQW